MSRFNNKTPKKVTRNLAGGKAYKQSTKLELASLLLTSFVTDAYYRSADETLERVRELISGLKDKVFAAKAAVYARTKFHMRSISHAVAAELFSSENKLSGSPWLKNFVNRVVIRPDDATEILSYFENNVIENSIPNQLKKGLALSLSKFDEYQLAKYRGENKEVSLVDLVNITHPVPNKKNSRALKKLVEDTLRSTKTWESKMTQAGQKAEDAEDLAEQKGKVWNELLKEGTLPYFALLRNLRNIAATLDKSLVEEACAQLVDKKAIAHSRILPFRYLTALDEVQKLPSSVYQRALLVALNDAVDIACQNAPAFDGETLVAVDISGSMSGQVSAIAALFAAILFKANNADVIRFDNVAEYSSGLNPRDSVLTIAQQIAACRGGTDFNSIFRSANKAYDRIIILSDMQGWIGRGAPTAAFNTYKRQFNANPMIYSFDLQGYGTLQFPEERVMAIAGFSDKVFSVMEKLEGDKNALVAEIEAIEL